MSTSQTPPSMCPATYSSARSLIPDVTLVSIHGKCVQGSQFGPTEHYLFRPLVLIDTPGAVYSAVMLPVKCFDLTPPWTCAWIAIEETVMIGISLL